MPILDIGHVFGWKCNLCHLFILTLNIITYAPVLDQLTYLNWVITRSIMKLFGNLNWVITRSFMKLFGGGGGFKSKKQQQGPHFQKGGAFPQLTSKNKRKRKVFTSKRGVWSHPSHPAPTGLVITLFLWEYSNVAFFSIFYLLYKYTLCVVLWHYKHCSSFMLFFYILMLVERRCSRLVQWCNSFKRKFILYRLYVCIMITALSSPYHVILCVRFY